MLASRRDSGYALEQMFEKEPGAIVEVEASVYAQLSAPFDVTFTDVRGGVEVTFISGEQVVSRLNEVLGVAGWSFHVLRQEIHAEADEVWALGELVADIEGRTVARQQFGSQNLSLRSTLYV
jgi:hypothetical protein